MLRCAAVQVGRALEERAKLQASADMAALQVRGFESSVETRRARWRGVPCGPGSLWGTMLACVLK